MTIDIPNEFAQTDIFTKNEERIVMKIKGHLANMLTEMDQETYAKYIVEENNIQVLYVEVKKALYRILQTSLLFYEKLRKDLEDIGFKVNPYDPCEDQSMCQKSSQQSGET